MSLLPPDITGLIANSLLPELSWQLGDEDWRQGWLSRSALRCAAVTLLDLLDTHDVPDGDQLVRGAEQALATAAAARAGLSSDDHIVAIALLTYANSLLAACHDRGIGEADIEAAVVRELDRHVIEFLDGRRPLPPRQ